MTLKSEVFGNRAASLGDPGREETTMDHPLIILAIIAFGVGMFLRNRSEEREKRQWFDPNVELNLPPMVVKKFITKASPAEVIRAVAGQAPLHGYNIRGLEEEKCRIVLGDGKVDTHNRPHHTYSVVAQQTDEGTLVTVGMRRAPMALPQSPEYVAGILNRLGQPDEKFFNAVRAMVLAAGG